MRSLVYLLSFLLCTNVNAATSSISFFHGQQHSNSIASKSLLKVDVFYYRDFPYRQHYAHRGMNGCIKMPAAGIVRCKEVISLLREENTINNWLRIQNKKGYLPLTMKASGIINTVGHISKITSAGFSSVNKKTADVNSPYRPATGIFIRHVTDVRQYTFKNIKTNVVFSVKATPEHPVYSVNRQAFIPVSHLSTEDYLLSEDGQKIHLICPQGLKNSCGVSFNKGGITSVYNVETSQRHTYFVQSEKLLVHNCDNNMRKVSMGQDTGKKADVSKSDKNNYPSQGKVRLVLRAKSIKKPVLTGEEYTVQEVLEARDKVRSKSFSLYSRVNVRGLSADSKGGVKMRTLAVIDHEGSVAPYSSLENLSLDNGRLMNDSMPVTENLSNFNFTKEIMTQGAINVGYYTMQAAGGTLMVVGGIGLIFALFAYGLYGTFYCGPYNGYCF